MENNLQLHKINKISINNYSSNYYLIVFIKFINLQEQDRKRERQLIQLGEAAVRQKAAPSIIFWTILGPMLD